MRGQEELKDPSETQCSGQKGMPEGLPRDKSYPDAPFIQHSLSSLDKEALLGFPESITTSEVMETDAQDFHEPYSSHTLSPHLGPSAHGNPVRGINRHQGKGPPAFVSNILGGVLPQKGEDSFPTKTRHGENLCASTPVEARLNSQPRFWS